MKARAWAVPVVALAAAAVAWFLLGGGRPETSGSVSAPAPATIPVAAMPAVPASPADPTETDEVRHAGVLEGTVVRAGRPALASVTARFLQREVAFPLSMDIWRQFLANSALYGGLEAAPRAQAESGADGRWSFRGLGPGIFLFEATSADGLRGAAVALLGRDGLPVPEPDGSRPPLVLRLRAAGCVLRGRAALADGRPWTGFVGICRDDLSRADPAPVQASPEGTFRFEGLPPGIVRLFTLVPGRSRLLGPLVLLACADEVAVVVGEGLRQFEGGVVDDATGRPIPGADVTVETSTSSLVLRGDGWGGGEKLGVDTVRTDAKGRYQVLLPVEPGSGPSVHVHAEGYLDADDWNESSDASASTIPDIRLKRPGVVTGRVLVAATGAALPGVRVLYDRNDPAAPSAMTDAEGRYRLAGIPSGWVSLVAIGEGWLSPSLTGIAGAPGAEGVEVPPGGEAELDLHVVPGPRIRGRVVDASGNGVGGLTVEAQREHAEGPMFSKVDMVFTALPGRAVTGPDGAFRLSVAAGKEKVRIVALRDGRPVAAGGLYELEPESETVVVMRIPAGRRLVVRVEEEGGGPIEGALVRVAAVLIPGQESLSLGREATTGPDGTAAFDDVPEIPLEVTGSTPDPFGSEARVDVDGPDTGEPVVVRVYPGPKGMDLAVEGLAVFEDGTPASGAWVGVEQVASRSRNEDPRFAWDSSFSEGARPDGRGRFRVEHLEDGDYEVTVRSSRGEAHFAGVAQAAAGATDVRVVLRAVPEREIEPLRQVEVRILGPEGAPVPGGHLDWEVRSAEESHRSSYSGMTYADGVAVLELSADLLPGVVRLEASRAVDAKGRALPLAHEVLGPVPLGEGPIVVRLKPGMAVEGRVVGEGEAPIPGIWVTARAVPDVPGEDWASHSDVGKAETDAAGRFRIGGLADREYSLSCDSHGFLPVEGRGRPGGGEVTLRLQRTVDVRVRVLDPEGQPVGGASVSVKYMGPGPTHENRVAGSQTLATGTTTLSGLRPDGDFALEVDPPYSSCQFQSARIEGWKPADTEVRLLPGYALAVRVEDPQGRPLDDVHVECRRVADASQPGDQTTGADGRVRFTHLPAGPVVVTAWFTEAQDEATRVAVNCSAESGKAVLVLDPGAEIRFSAPDLGRGECLTVRLAARGEAEPTRDATGKGREVRVRGLREGVLYEAVVSEEYSARVAVLWGIRAGGAIVDVPLAEGRRIVGRVLVRSDDTIESIAVLVGDAGLFPVKWLDTDAGGAFTTDGLPFGRWNLRVRLKDGGGATRTVTAWAQAGGTVEIDAR